MALQFGKTIDPAIVNLRRFERLPFGTRQETCRPRGEADDAGDLRRLAKLTPRASDASGFAEKIRRWNRLTFVKKTRPTMVKVTPWPRRPLTALVPDEKRPAAGVLSIQSGSCDFWPRSEPFRY